MAETDAFTASNDTVEGVSNGNNGAITRRALPPVWQKVLDRKHASNGLTYEAYLCENCGHHLFDNAVVLGVVRKKCPVCKYPNEREFNRVGEDQTMESVENVVSGE